ncbi:MAG TPA: hypothetical protein VGN63_01245 [Flavisolibacter sp.]|jgi:hypothetical protein|nr:hypothetical protein [Flavisolibacter sp.]
MWAQIINIVIGLFLMFAPSIWSFDKATSDHHYIVGPLIITNAIIALWEFNRGIRWLNVLIGAWLLVSPFVLGNKGIVATIDIASAILLILFSLFKGSVQHRYGGGWSSLFQKNPVHLKEAAGKEQ